jgi:hypothetical protein
MLECYLGKTALLECFGWTIYVGKSEGLWFIGKVLFWLLMLKYALIAAVVWLFPAWIFFFFIFLCFDLRQYS